MPASHTPLIYVCDPIHEAGLDRLRQVGRVIVLDRAHSAEALMDVARDADALIVRSRTRIPADLILALPRLKLIARAGAGLDGIDVSTARARGINVINAPDANTLAVAEHTMGLILALARNLTRADAALKAGRWAKSELMGLSLRGKTLGIIGFGRIGRQVARLAAPFGMRIIVNQPRLTPELALSEGAMPHDLHDLLAQSDFVTLHVPMRAQNQNMIAADELAMMKQGAFLINTARGGLVDEAALLAALESGHLAGAGIDVFASEPTPDPALVQHPRVIATPHIAASTHEAQRDAALAVAEQIAELLDVWASSTGSLNLRVVPLSDIVTHEHVDPKRVERLAARFEKSGALSDPPVVSFWDGKYVVLDGATRTHTFHHLGIDNIAVQVVNAEDDITLHTWNHAVSRLDFAAFLDGIAAIPHLHVRASTLEEAEAHLHSGAAFAFLNHLSRGIYLLDSDAPTWLERLDAVREVVDLYNRMGEVERTLVNDMTRLRNDFPGLTMTVTFRPLDTKEVLQAAAHGHPMPAGVTRFVIPGRILRLNLSLEDLRRPGSLEEKNVWLQAWLHERMARASVRYYQEPVVLLDG